MTKSGERYLLGFLLGDRENKDTWTALVQDLLDRGMDRNALALVLSDDHKAIVTSVADSLGLPHQLCVVHKMRNALARVAHNHQQEFRKDFKAIYWAASKEDAFQAIGRLEQKWHELYPKATQIAVDRPHDFLRFMDQPRELWTTLRSTNLIERFIRELRRRLRPAGAMQSEDELFKIVWSVSVEQEKRWQHRKLKGLKNLKLAA
jgi:transposase-like protein